jgi:UDP-N-acetylmuramyl pentapeptide phosphotransferase/UDP-N-acetylglucosamine-1-phosphate transferase
VYTLILLGCSAFVISFVLTPLLREIFRRLGIVDVPGDARKIHKAAIPRCGGAPLAAAYLGSFVVLMFSPLQGGSIAKGAVPIAVELLLVTQAQAGHFLPHLCMNPK